MGYTLNTSVHLSTDIYRILPCTFIIIPMGNLEQKVNLTCIWMDGWPDWIHPEWQQSNVVSAPLCTTTRKHASQSGLNQYRKIVISFYSVLDNNITQINCGKSTLHMRRTPCMEKMWLPQPLSFERVQTWHLFWLMTPAYLLLWSVYLVTSLYHSIKTRVRKATCNSSICQLSF